MVKLVDPSRFFTCFAGSLTRVRRITLPLKIVELDQKDEQIGLGLAHEQHEQAMMRRGAE
jgi:hypothetical protein